MPLSQNDISLKIGFDIQQLTAELNKTNTMMAQWSTGIKSQLTQAFSIASGLYLLQSGIRNAIQNIAEFNHSMKAVEAVSGATGESLSKLRDNALKMAGAFRANDIAQFELEMERMGFTAREVTDMTQAVINLAAATGEDLVKAGEYAGSTMRNFGLKATDMTRITDVMQGALNQSSMKLSDFGEAMKYVGPVANQAGMSLESLAAWMTILANNGIKASMMGTSLRRIITDLGLQGKLSEEGLKAFGAAALSGGAAYEEFGRIAQSVAIVMSHNGKIHDELEKSIGQQGITAKMAATTQDDMVGAWNRVLAAYDRLINKGSWVNDMFKSFLNVFRSNIDIISGNWGAKMWWNDLFPSNKSDFDKRVEGIFKPFQDYISKLNEDVKKSEFYKMFTGGGVLEDPKKKQSKGIDPMLASIDYYNSKDTIGKMEKRISDLNQKIKDTVAQGDIDKYRKQIENLETAIFKMMNNTELSTAKKHIASDTSANDKIGLSAVPSSVGEVNPFKALQDNLKNTEKTMETFKGRYQTFWEKLAVSDKQWIRQVRAAFIQVGTSFSDGFANIVSGAQSASEAFANMAMSIIDSLERIAIAYVIENSAALGPFGVFAALAGIGVVKGLFQGLLGGKSNVSTGSSGGGVNFSNQKNNINITGEFTVRGQDLILALNRNTYNRSRAGG